MKPEKKPVRVSLPKTALPRLFFIDREIASGNYPKCAEMAKKYETSVSSIVRDIAYMKDMLRAPIGYDARRRGYYYTKKNYRIPAGFASAEDMLALGMAKSILSLYTNTPIYDSARQLLDNITAPLAAGEQPPWYENRIVVPSVPAAPVPPETWKLVTSALRENRILSFEYRGIYDTESKSRRVRPYQLLFDTGVWYLYGYAEDRAGIRIFSLCRMNNIVLTTARFSLPKDFDYRTNNSGSYFGVFTGQRQCRFRIAFYDESAAWVQDRQWAADQTIEKADDGVIVSFTSTQMGKVLEWVLSRGCTAEPLEPEALVDLWRRNVEEMGRLAEV